MTDTLLTVGKRWLARLEGLQHAAQYQLEQLASAPAMAARVQAEMAMQAHVDIRMALDEVPHAQFTEIALQYPPIGQRLTTLQDRLHKLQQKLHGEAHETLTTLNLGEGNDNDR